MKRSFHLFPEQASNFAQEVDALYAFLVIVSGLMTLAIFLCIFYFAIKYRRRSDDERPLPIIGSLKLELFWSISPLFIMLIMFAWGAKLYYSEYAGFPRDTIDIYVTGKQWMWKVQYPEGQREINELHVPVGKPVKLTLASEDVIHSFYIPDFRVKHDVVPGHYTQMWFTATKPGVYHLFCAEYCGNQHSGMIGYVTALDPVAYQNWLQGGGADGSMASQGEKLFQQFGCSSCHILDQQGRCPTLRNVYGHNVLLDNGKSVMGDEAYIRESILQPNAKIVYGYKQDIMPSFTGQVSEEQLLQLIVYVKSLSVQQPAAAIGSAQSGRTTGAARFGDTQTPANLTPSDATAPKKLGPAQ